MSDVKQSVVENDSETRDDFVVVGLGASAGGVEALETFFSAMPVDAGIAIVVVQHLSPNFESLMPQIIARRTKLPVKSAEDGDVICPNQIYVLPAGKEIILSNGRIRLKNREGGSQVSLTIDQFFRSLAQEYRERAVAVVLSGTGCDGSSGILDVHDANGFVIVQTEASAKFNGMPRAAASSGVADTVVPVAEIPEVLVRFNQTLRDPQRNAGLPENFEEQVARILQLLRKNFSIDFAQYKDSMIRRRIERRLMLSDELQINFDSYVTRLEKEPDELNQLFCDLLIGVTEFFRDPDAFDLLREEVLPELLQKCSVQGTFRAWVAPTATGEEAYSLAMLVDEVVNELDLTLEVKIFATDAHSTSIEFASRGIYPASSIEKVSGNRIDRYFRENDDGFHVCRHIRKMVVFAEHNVLSDAPFTRLDMICCRNLLIYLKPNAQQKVLSLFNFGLNKDGLLFLGPSESVAEFDADFKSVSDKWRLYSKARSVQPSKFSIDLTPKNRPDRSGGVTTSSSGFSLADTYDQLIDEFIPPSLLVNEDGEIAHVFSGASNFLSIGEGRPTTNVLKMLPDPFKVAVANGMKRAQAQSDAVMYAGLRCEIGGRMSTYRVTIRPIQNRRARRTDFLISFVDSGVSLSPESPAELDAGTANIERVKTLEEELRDTRESLHASIQELKSANEEMQTTNEELIASNEELQSTNEELQSTNEELHSVNEELYTVNSEHQRKIAELTELTDDMENLLDSIRVDTIFLDKDLKLRKFTLGIARTFRLIPQDVGRQIDSFNHDLRHPDLVSDIQSVLDSEQPLEQEVQHNTGAWYLMRLLPYTSRGRVDGVLLTLIEITAIKETEQRLAELSEIVEVSDDAIFRVDAKGGIRTWNRGAETLYGYSADQVIDKKMDVLMSKSHQQVSLDEVLSRSSKKGPIDHIQMKHLRKNGDAIDVALTISPITDLEGHHSGASVVIRDITLEKRAKEEVERAVTVRDEFLAMLSHELRNPLAAILNAESLLREADLDPSAAADAQEVAQTQLSHLTRLLDDLLDVARITNDKLSLQLEVIDLRKSMFEATECVQHQIDRKGQRLFVESVDQPVFVLGDVGRLQQAQVNLLVNACKYTPLGGEIHFQLEIEDDEAILTVSDNGIGISSDLADSIFDLFVQSKQALDRSQGGMGLGLPLVKMIAAAHGGSVHLRSDGKDQGSTFSLRLPLTTNSPSESKKPNIEKLTKKKLLIIEDNDGIRSMLARSLQLKGLQVAAAADAMEGLSLIDDFGPEIAVVDIGLPDVDGYEVARRMRGLPGGDEILMVAVTGYGRADDKAKAFEAGFDAHIVKPIDVGDLITQLASLRNRAEDKNKIQ